MTGAGAGGGSTPGECRSWCMLDYCGGRCMWDYWEWTTSDNWYCWWCLCYAGGAVLVLLVQLVLVVYLGLTGGACVVLAVHGTVVDYW